VFVEGWRRRKESKGSEKREEERRGSRSRSSKTRIMCFHECLSLSLTLIFFARLAYRRVEMVSS